MTCTWGNSGCFIYVALTLHINVTSTCRVSSVPFRFLFVVIYVTNNSKARYVYYTRTCIHVCILLT